MSTRVNDVELKILEAKEPPPKPAVFVNHERLKKIEAVVASARILLEVEELEGTGVDPKLLGLKASLDELQSLH